MKCFIKMFLLILVSIGRIYAKNPVLDVEYSELVKCVPWSIVSELELSPTNLYLEIPCDGPYKSSFHWWLYNATIDGEVVPLEIPELNKESRIEDGKLILNSSGMIIYPVRCAGDSYQDSFVYKLSTPFECSVDNYPDKIRAIYSNTYITGKCSSKCSDVKASFQVVGPGIM